MEQFVIRAYGFNELARLYFPDVASKSASNRLRSWIKSNCELTQSLLDAGYQNGQKMFSPRQVSCIVDAFGAPFSPAIC